MIEPTESEPKEEVDRFIDAMLAIKAEIDEQAATYEDPKEVVRWFYSNPSRLKDIENLVLEDNVIKYFTSLAKVSDKPISFEELSKLN